METTPPRCSSARCGSPSRLTFAAGSVALLVGLVVLGGCGRAEPARSLPPAPPGTTARPPSSAYTNQDLDHDLRDLGNQLDQSSDEVSHATDDANRDEGDAP